MRQQQYLLSLSSAWIHFGAGPCGPCTELYYDLQPGQPTAGASLEDDSRFIEFYNLVFMESNKGPSGDLTPLAARNIDTGLGLERMAQILQVALPASGLPGIRLHTDDSLHPAPTLLGLAASCFASFKDYIGLKSAGSIS